jgi:hypothetical protein
MGQTPPVAGTRKTLQRYFQAQKIRSFRTGAITRPFFRLRESSPIETTTPVDKTTPVAGITEGKFDRGELLNLPRQI